MPLIIICQPLEVDLFCQAKEGKRMCGCAQSRACIPICFLKAQQVAFSFFEKFIQ